MGRLERHFVSRQKYGRISVVDIPGRFSLQQFVKRACHTARARILSEELLCTCNAIYSCEHAFPLSSTCAESLQVKRDLLSRLDPLTSPSLLQCHTYAIASHPQSYSLAQR